MEALADLVGDDVVDIIARQYHELKYVDVKDELLRFEFKEYRVEQQSFIMGPNTGWRLVSNTILCNGVEMFSRMENLSNNNYTCNTCRKRDGLLYRNHILVRRQ